MDPQKLLFLDKRVIRTIRGAGLLLSLLLAFVCVLVYTNALTIAGSYHWACLPIAAGLTVLGLVEALWGPYTREKIAVYVSLYMLLGALLSILVLGFSTMIFMGWTILIMVTVIFLGLKQAALGYGLMTLSLFAWLNLHAATHTAADVVAYGVSALVVGILCLLILNVWRLTNDSILRMEEAHTRQNYEHGQLTSLINSMGDGVIAVDTTTKVILYNAAALNLLDINSSMQGKAVSNFVHISDEDGHAVDLTKLIVATKTPTINRDYRVKYTDGSFANLYLSIAPVHLGYGKGGEHGFVLIMRDITREKSLEEERDEFISVVSHELRTPVAITEGEVSNAQLIAEKTGGSDTIKTALEEAHNQVLFLSDMINDLSTLSRAERGVLKLDVEDIAIADLLKELESNYQKQATDKGLKLEARLPKDQLTLHSSKLYVREVLQNFITNSIKYTQKGSVTFTAVAAEHGGVEFNVTDTGIGISKQDQKRVFEKFFRSEDYRTRATNGTGLGLYVTKKLIKLLDADISVQSELNKGSTFSVTVPNLKTDKQQVTKK
jgi:PAS domain S-box-containing protein